MSPSFSYQRHTPGRVPFEDAFSWHGPICPESIGALSELCATHDGHRNLDDGLLQEVLAGSAQAWLESEGRAYVHRGPTQLELLVHPQWRGQGWGSWLLAKALETRPTVTAWAYGDRDSTVEWLERNHFTSHRVLYKMVYQESPPAPPEWPTPWRLEIFREEDAEDWHRLHVGLQKDPTRAWSLDRLHRQLKQPKTPCSRFWLLWEGPQLRGYLWLKQDEIFLLALDPAARGQGIGRRLLQWAMSQAGQAWGFCDQSETLELYRKLGFCEVGRDRCLRRCK